MLDKYRMTEADMAELNRCAPGVKWKRSQDGGAEGRIAGMLIWLTRESPYHEPRGGWMVQILLVDDEMARFLRTSIARTVAAASRWLTAEAAPMLRAAEALKPVEVAK